MATAIMALLVGLVSALPEILKLIETHALTTQGAKQANAKEDTDVLDTILGPPGGVS